jgi:phage terminase small subunit
MRRSNLKNHRQINGKGKPIKRTAATIAKLPDGRELYKVAIDAYFDNGASGGAAYRAAGGRAKGASSAFNALLKTEQAQAYYKKRAKEFRADVEKRTDAIRQRLSDIAEVDASEYMDIIRVNCRYCHSQDHAMQQLKPTEWRAMMRKYEEDCAFAQLCKNPMPEMPECEPGFEPLRRPHPRCPECGGAGHIHERLKPTSEWSPRARRAFGGIKKTKDGIEFKILDMHKALDSLARMDNMFAKHEGAGAGEVHIHFDDKDAKA